MQVGTKYFPYPILNQKKSLSNYPKAKFELSYDTQETADYYTLVGVRVQTDSSYVNRLWERGFIDVWFIIECSYSLKRDRFKVLPNVPLDIPLFKGDYCGKVVFSAYGVVKKDFVLDCEEFDEDYLNISFPMESHDIIAADDGFQSQFDKKDEEDNFASSIFSIIVNKTQPDGPYSVNARAERKIVITLSMGDHEKYRKIYASAIFKDIFFNMLLIPALVEALSEVAKEKENYADIDDVQLSYPWFKSIREAYKKIKGEELTLDTLVNQVRPVELAQELLGCPVGRSLETMLNELIGVDTEE